MHYKEWLWMWLTTPINHNYILLVYLVLIFTLVVYQSLLLLGLTFEFPSVIELVLNLKKIIESLLSFLALDYNVKVIAPSTFSLDLTFETLKHYYINMNNHAHE